MSGITGIGAAGMHFAWPTTHAPAAEAEAPALPTTAELSVARVHSRTVLPRVEAPGASTMATLNARSAPASGAANALSNGDMAPARRGAHAAYAASAGGFTSAARSVDFSA